STVGRVRLIYFLCRGALRKLVSTRESSSSTFFCSCAGKKSIRFRSLNCRRTRDTRSLTPDADLPLRSSRPISLKRLRTSRVPGSSRELKKLHDFAVADSLNKPSFTNAGFAAAFHNFTHDPVKLLF